MEDVEHKRRNQILRLLAYLLLASTSAYAIWLTDKEAENRSIAVCQETNKIRSVLIELIEGDSTSTLDRIDTSKLSPEILAFLSAIAQASADSSEDFENKAKRLLKLQDCDEL
jgi:hypothetical protein